MASNMNRRSFIGSSLLGAAAGISLENKTLLGKMAEGAGGEKKEPVQGLPKGRIGSLEVSRLICGGNLFSGFAHSRELIYVSSLMTHYFTDEKIMETLALCEENGINTAILRCDEHIVQVLTRYRKEMGGKIQWIAQTYPSEKDLTSNIQLAVDNGAVGAFPQGGIGDTFYKDGKFDLLAKSISFIKQNGLVAGVGSHDLSVTKMAEKEQIGCDFYFKTFNNEDYNSEPVADISAWFKSINKPWIAYKILGAGLKEPNMGFRRAFSLGADFINVGMFDFQVHEDAATARDILTKNLERERPWCS
ncbi:MAG TPA: hypothetical protein VJ417_10035 [Candidatus Glassbacteria bacterium]|nr:hypothetical protein [Candidatus Glassbacteria bacterium]